MYGLKNGREKLDSGTKFVSREGALDTDVRHICDPVQGHKGRRVDEAERELWCKAWRLMVQHGDDVVRVIDTELQRSLYVGDSDGAAEWRQIAVAVEQLAK